jgi:hypothetical protein
MQGENMAMIGLTKATTFASTFSDIVGWGVAAHRAVLSYLTFGNRGNKEIARTREELELDSALFEFVVDAHRFDAEPRTNSGNSYISRPCVCWVQKDWQPGRRLPTL